MEYYLTQFGWFLELGAVTIIATILSILLVNLCKVTVLRKYLATATATSKDQALGLLGTVVSLVLFGIVYVAGMMIQQHTFFIEINWKDSLISIVSGASVTWVAAKGLYTVLHKFFSRIRAGKELKDAAKEATQELNRVRYDVEAAKEKSKKVAGTNDDNGRWR